MTIKAIPVKAPASHPEIIDCLQTALACAYSKEVKDIAISIHLKDGGYFTIESIRTEF